MAMKATRRKATPEEIANFKPHIVKRFYDDKGNLLGWIADDFVVKTQEEVDAILDEVSDIWSRHCANKAAEAVS